MDKVIITWSKERLTSKEEEEDDDDDFVGSSNSSWQNFIYVARGQMGREDGKYKQEDLRNG